MDKIYYGTELCLGSGSLKRLNDYKNKTVLVVSDPFLVESGRIKEVVSYFDESNDITVFSQIVPDPPIETVVSGIKSVDGKDVNVIVAVGGGSAIDAAKAMYYFGKRQGAFLNAVFIAIPTTSGTGSEVTDFSIITDTEKETKYPLISREILPQVAILDANLVLSLPGNVTADTGMDVLTHAIEAIVSTKATDFSDALAEKAIKLVFKYLPRAYKDGNDVVAREKMHAASTLAGMAFNTASLGLNHGIAHAAGAKLHIPHGRLNSIIMPAVIAYNANITTGGKVGFDKATAIRYQKIAKLLGHTATNPAIAVRQLIGSIKQLQKALSMPDSFSKYGITLQQFNEVKQEVAEHAIEDRCTDTNPRVPTVDEVIKVLEQSF